MHTSPSTVQSRIDMCVCMQSPPALRGVYGREAAAFPGAPIVIRVWVLMINRFHRLTAPGSQELDSEA